MNYNDGAVKDPTKIKDKKKAAHDFSEGNCYLEIVLNNCFNNNILTFACCAGHKERNYLPYIGFYLVKNNENYINCLIKLLYEKGYIIEFSNGVYNSVFTLRCNNCLNANKFFDDINNAINYAKTNRVSKQDLDKSIQKLYNMALNSNEYYLGRIEKNNGKMTLMLSFDNFLETVSYDDARLNQYLNNIIALKFKNYQDDKALILYDVDDIDKKIWQEFYQFLEENDIELKDISKVDITDKKGNYVLDNVIQCELIVNSNDTIYTVANKLYKLQFFYSLNTKGIINGIEINNVDYIENDNINGRILYKSNFTIDRCVSNYENLVLEQLNKDFNNELIILKNSPLAIITFNNDKLSEEELARRIFILKQNKLDIVLKYRNLEMGFGILANNQKEIDINDIIKDILLCISGSNDINLIYSLFDLYQFILSNLDELNVDYENKIKYIYELYCNYIASSDITLLKRNGYLNYLDSISGTSFMDISDYCLLVKLLSLIKYCKKNNDDDKYYDYLIKKIENSDLNNKDLALIINSFLDYFEKNAQSEVRNNIY